jgi:hypothetical protein
MSVIKIHTSKDAVWTNASSDPVPYKYVPATDRQKETLAGAIYKKALSIEAALQSFHEMMSDAIVKISAEIKKEYELRYNKQKQGKGSFTWFNFDRSIKVEADMNDIVKWDGSLMTEAKTLLDSYITSNMSEANELISALVTSAFANTKGMIDSGKVFQILRYQDKIKAAKFQKACELMKQAQSIDKTKLYMRVWCKQEDGSYRNINLNFSSL